MSIEISQTPGTKETSWWKTAGTSAELIEQVSVGGELTGAQIVVSSLLTHGVKTIFGYPGAAVIPIYDALYDVRHLLHHVLVRHEQAAAHAAEGYARATGKVGVCLATSGPSATNLLTGITDAMLDSVPVVCIAGQVSSCLLGKDSFQEADLIGMTIPICKWNYQVTRTEDIPWVLNKAFHVARSGRPGPAVVVITKDAQTRTYKSASARSALEIRQLTSELSQEQLHKAASLLNEAQRPLMIIGQGVLISGAENLVLELSRKADIPVASTLMGLSAVPASESHYAGMVGMHGNIAPNILSNRADVILAVGTRFSDRVTGDLKRYAKQARLIHVDIDPSEIGKNVRVQVPVIGDAKEVLSKLSPLVRPATHPHWAEQFKHYREKEWLEVIQEATQPHTGKLRMSETVALLSRMTDGQSLVVADVGQHQMMAARYYGFEQRGSFLTSGGLGTMGFALPAALGASLGLPARDVIVITGDGSFQMNMQELATVVQEGVPLKIILFNNENLGMVRQWQELFFERRYSCTAMQNPDYVKLAEAFGIAASRVSEREDLLPALQQLLNSKNASLLEVVVEKEENVFPMIPPGAAVDEIRTR